MNTNVSGASLFSRSPVLPLALSLTAALLFFVYSAAAVLTGMPFYASESLYFALYTNDILNLALGLPLTVFALLFIKRGSPASTAGLAGMLLFFLYNSAACLFTFQNPISIVINALISVFSLLSVFLLTAAADGTRLPNLPGRALPRVLGGTLAFWGLVFIGRSIPILLNPSSPLAEKAVAGADLLTCPFWIAAGIHLITRSRLSTLTGPAAGFQASLLFAALALLLALRPFITGTAVPTADIIVILVMGLTVIIPFVLLTVQLTRQSRSGNN